MNLKFQVRSVRLKTRLHNCRRRGINCILLITLDNLRFNYLMVAIASRLAFPHHPDRYNRMRETLNENRHIDIVILSLITYYIFLLPSLDPGRIEI